MQRSDQFLLPKGKDLPPSFPDKMGVRSCFLPFRVTCTLLYRTEMRRSGVRLLNDKILIIDDDA